MTIAFTKVRLPFGWLGNMSPFTSTVGLPPVGIPSAEASG